jgi:hypothetical protein
MFWSDLVRSDQHSQLRRSFRQTALCGNEQYRQESKSTLDTDLSANWDARLRYTCILNLRLMLLGLANLTAARERL